jgi:hypothetical protein
MKTLRKLPKGFQLAEGSHGSFDRGACAMEAVAYIAGEKHSDHPRCACPLITELAIWLNDNCCGDDRQELLSDLISRLVGTRGAGPVMRKRGLMAAEWIVSFLLPIYASGLGDEVAANELSQLRIADEASAAHAMTVIGRVFEFRTPLSCRACAVYALGSVSRGEWQEVAFQACFAANKFDSYLSIEKIRRSCRDLIIRMIEVQP